MSSAAGPSASSAAGSSPGAERHRDPAQDIAKTIALEQMRIEAPDRQPFQHVFLRGVKSSTTKYDPTQDGVTQGIPTKLPSNTELLPGDNTKEYLEVGLIIGSEPDKYVPKGGRNKIKDQERERRGVMPRDQHAMRAYIGVTETVVAQAKFYVGCRMAQGRLEPRVIQAAQIFFYPEFWAKLDVTVDAKTRLTAMSKLCKNMAAKSQTIVDRVAPPLTADEIANIEALHPMPVTTLANKNQFLILQYNLYEKTGERKYLDAMLHTLEATSPGIDQDGSESPAIENHTNVQVGGDGIEAFFNFASNLSEADAVQVAKELKTATPLMPEFDPLLIEATHKILCRGDQGRKLGDKLPRYCLGFFLAECVSRIGSHDEVTPKGVQKVLQTIENYTEQLPARLPTQPRSGTDTEPSLTNFRTVLKCVSEALENIELSLNEAANEVLKQHGGLLKHQSLHDIMKKLGEAVDVATMQSLTDQLARLQLAQYHAQQREVPKCIRRLRSLIDELLKANDDA